MAKILKCPRCQSTMDVTSVSPGSTVRCPDCGQMVRVPSGSTNLAVKTISEPIPPPAPVPAPRERGTRIRERSRSSSMNPTLPTPEKSNSGLWIGLSIGALAVVAVIFAFTANKHEDAPPPRANAPKETGTVVFQPKLPPSSEKPIVLKSGDKPEDPKPTQLARPAETADNINWDALIRELRAGGGFDHPDRPEGVAFAKVKSFGKAAYPKLIAYIDHEQPEFGIAAVAVLNALTGRDSALPKGVTKSKIKAEWEEWLKSADAAKPDAPKQP